MPLNPADKAKCRYHLGYPATGTNAASVQFGIPKPMQTAFLLESAMDLILEDACNRVRQIIAILDSTEVKLVEAQDRLAASALGSLKLRENEPDMLDREYNKWADRLADQFGVPKYPFAVRFRAGSGGAAMIPVR